MIRKRLRKRVVLWGGRAGDLQFGSEDDLAHERDLRLAAKFRRELFGMRIGFMATSHRSHAHVSGITS